MKDQKYLIERKFLDLDFNVIYWNEKPNANGVDCYVQKDHESINKKPLSVEIKMIKKNPKTGALYVEPIGKKRIKDDLIAIIINSEYVLIEPMSHHLLCCGPKGFRAMTIYK